MRLKEKFFRPLFVEKRLAHSLCTRTEEGACMAYMLVWRARVEFSTRSCITGTVDVKNFWIVGGFYQLRPGPVHDLGAARALTEPLRPNTTNFPS